jgi:hypothetical protein
MTMTMPMAKIMAKTMAMTQARKDTAPAFHKGFRSVVPKLTSAFNCREVVGLGIRIRREESGV